MLSPHQLNSYMLDCKMYCQISEKLNQLLLTTQDEFDRMYYNNRDENRRPARAIRGRPRRPSSRVPMTRSNGTDSNFMHMSRGLVMQPAASYQRQNQCYSKQTQLMGKQHTNQTSSGSLMNNMCVNERPPSRINAPANQKIWQHSYTTNNLKVNGQSSSSNVQTNQETYSVASLNNLKSNQMSSQSMNFYQNSTCQAFLLNGFSGAQNTNSTINNMNSSSTLINFNSKSASNNLYSMPSNLNSISTPNTLNSISSPNILNSLLTPSKLHSISKPNTLNSISSPNNFNSMSTPNNLYSTPNNLNSMSTVNNLYSPPSNLNSISTPNTLSSISSPNNLSSISSPNNFSSISTPNNLNSISLPNNMNSTSTPDNLNSISLPNNLNSMSTPNNFELASFLDYLATNEHSDVKEMSFNNAQTVNLVQNEVLQPSNFQQPNIKEGIEQDMDAYLADLERALVYSPEPDFDVKEILMLADKALKNFNEEDAYSPFNPLVIDI